MKLRKLFTFLVLNLLLVSCNNKNTFTDLDSMTKPVYIFSRNEISTDIVKQDSYIETTKEIVDTIEEGIDINITTHNFETNRTGFKYLEYKDDSDDNDSKTNAEKNCYNQTDLLKRSPENDYNLTFYAQPYRSVGLVKSTFYNVKTSSDPLTYSTYTFYSSAFLVNKDVVITNSDAILKNLNYSGDDDYRFADKVEIDFGYHNNLEYEQIVDETVTVTSAYIDKETYNDKNSNYDFAVLSINKSLPKYTTKFNILTDWYDESVNDDEGLFVVGFRNYSDNLGRNYNYMSKEINLKIISNENTTFNLNKLEETGTYKGSPAMYIGDDGTFNLCGIVNDFANKESKTSVKKFDNLILESINDIVSK